MFTMETLQSYSNTFQKCFSAGAFERLLDSSLFSTPPLSEKNLSKSLSVDCQNEKFVAMVAHNEPVCKSTCVFNVCWSAASSDNCSDLTYSDLTSPTWILPTSSKGNGCNSRSSSSCLSLLSESDIFDEPSTSGCSSEMATQRQSEKRKRQKVKDLLKELKSMMLAETGGRGKPGTLNTLDYVVNSMRKLAGEQNNLLKPSSSEPVALPSLQCPEFVDFRNVNDGIDLDTRSDLTVAVSLKNHVVLHCSTALMDMLGYPHAWWKGRLLKDFVHNKDVMTVNSYINSETSDAASAEFRGQFEVKDGVKQHKQFFFARIRRFRKLSSVFGIASCGSYVFFKVIVISKPPEPVTDLTTEEQKVTKRCMMLYFAPMTSPYKDGQLPEDPDQCVFSLRHSPFCTYTYTHANTIPLLGFLPQEIVGTSIFDFYHPEDLPQLLDIYRRAMYCTGQPCKSGLIRLRTRNGTYLTVTTELSSFMNPWDHKLEFIIAQHTVIEPPDNANVFEAGPEDPASVESRASNTYHALIQKIKDVLQKPLGMDPRPLTPSDSWEIGGSFHPAGCRHVDKEYDKHEKCQEQTSDVSSSIVDGKSISSLYRQVNYSLNIRKYLMSHPKTFSLSDEENADVDHKGDSDEDMNEEVEMQVEIPVCQPQSCSSSAQVHVSDQGIHEEAPSSPQPFSRDNTNMMQEAFDSQLALTEASLRKHTKDQELLYLQQASRQPHIFHMKSRKNSQQRSRQKRSRPVGFEETSSNLKFAKNSNGEKRMSRDTAGLFMSNIPISAVEFEGTKFQSAAFGELKPGSNLMGMMQAPYQLGMGLTMLSFSPTPGMPHLQPVVPSATSKMHWPYYSQPGYPLLPQMMTGLYQSAMPPVSTTSLSHDPLACEHSMDMPFSSSTEQHTASPEEPQKNGTDSDNPSHTEDSGSSLQYLLDAFSGSYSSPNEELDDRTHRKKLGNINKCVPKRSTVPPWLETINWTPDVQLRYQLPSLAVQAVLKRDEEAQKKMDQPESVKVQLDTLLKEMEHHDHLPALNEEADYIVYPKMYTSSRDSNSRQMEENALQEGYLWKQELTESVRPGDADKDKSTIYSRLLTPVEVIFSAEPPKPLVVEMPKHTMQSIKKENASVSIEMLDSDKKSVQGEEGCVAGGPEYSDKDQTAATVQTVNCAILPPKIKLESQLDSAAVPKPDIVGKLFVPLKVWMCGGSVLHQPDQVRALPFWQQEAHLSDDVAMHYSLCPQDLPTVLANDCRRLATMTQPDIGCQLLELMQGSAVKGGGEVEILSNEQVYRNAGEIEVPSHRQVCQKGGELVVLKDEQICQNTVEIVVPCDEQICQNGDEEDGETGVESSSTDTDTNHGAHLLSIN